MSAWVPEHSKRVSKASAKVTDAANTSRPELKSHQRARDTVISADGTWQALTSNNTPTSICLSTASTTTKHKQLTTIEDVEDEESPNGEASC
jgi:hypothetical protein